MYITIAFPNFGDYSAFYGIGDNGIVPNNLRKPDFMPTKLVYTLDMTVVDGSHVNEGYCALSYSWNQSGSIFYHPFHNKYERIDMGLHKIIYYDEHADIKEVKYVKFEGIIQRICKEFNIKYIWIDQMCINQNDKEEKQREIRNMHHIYGNAHLTVALVPEFDSDAPNVGANGEEYFKRLWTLEEAIKSKEVLYFGSNRHRWSSDGDHEPRQHSNEVFKPTTTNLLQRSPSELNVAQILYHAHQRTSTKEHDRVFALIHLFPEFMQHIDIDYEQPLENLMILFYGLLAKKDISILFFNKKSDDYNSAIQKYNFLPSWTGINGQHLYEDLITTLDEYRTIFVYGGLSPDHVIETFQNYDIIGKTMHVTSKFVTNDQPIDNDVLTIRKKDLPPPPDDVNDGDYERCECHLCIFVQLPGSNKTTSIQVTEHCYNQIINGGVEYFEQISKELRRLSRFMEIKKEKLYWCGFSDDYYETANINLGLLTEDVDDPYAQYMILSEVFFMVVGGINDDFEFKLLYPVLKKMQGEELYKAIGYCTIGVADSELENEKFFYGCKLPKQTFLIE